MIQTFYLLFNRRHFIDNFMADFNLEMTVACIRLSGRLVYLRTSLLLRNGFYKNKKGRWTHHDEDKRR